MKLEVLLGLRQPIRLEVAGEEYVVQPRDTRGWLLALEDPLPLLALLDLDDARRLNARIYDPDDQVDQDDVDRAFRDVVQSHTGLPWYVVDRLMASVIVQWSELSGLLALKGIDALHAPVDLVLAAVLALVREGQDEKARKKFDADLYKPPPAAALVKDEVPAGFDDDDAAAAWMAASKSSAVRGSA